MRVFLGLILSVVLIGAMPATGWAADGALSPGDTAWVISATALVLLMTLPGLAMFYAGLVHSNAVLSVFMHCFAIACLCSVLWLVVGYSLAFSDSVGGGLVGNLDKLFLISVTRDAMAGSIPEIVFATFQMTFAIITPALMVGVYVERIKFPAVLILSGAWLLIVYAPVCHWIWGGGWLAELGVMDFAGGLVVHATAGVSGLVIAIMLGGRRGFPGHPGKPHSPVLTATGAALLWVGWFGFNGGSQLAADGGAGMAIAVTHISAATAAITWVATEWILFRKATVIGAVTGVIAGLAAVTPASGFIGPLGALVIGGLAGVVCFYAADLVKKHWKIDDSLDVFAVHGIGGIIGSLLVAVLALGVLGGVGLGAGVTVGKQFGIQLIGLAATVLWSAIATAIIVKVTSLLTSGLRVDPESELLGLDLASHGEQGYDL